MYLFEKHLIVVRHPVMYPNASGYVPKCYKMKRISPTHKGYVKTDASNFGPISILPIPMKMFEKLCMIKFQILLRKTHS